MMTLRHFEIFRAVAETGNFTRAAERLYITQSAVSHAIRELEEKAETALFDRLSKSVQLTKSGRLLLEEVTPILSSCEALDARISCLEKQAPLHIVSSITIAAFWLPKILKAFQKDWPDILIHVDVVSAANAIEILRNGKADIALIEGAAPQGPFTCIPFASYPLYVVCAPDYLITHNELTLQQFCSEKLLLREKGSAIRDTLDSVLYLSGHTAQPAWTSVNSLALIEAAKAGFGITILPDVLVSEQLLQGELISLSVQDLLLRNELLAVHHRDKYLTTPLRALLLHIESTMS
ncbi:LysR family transcriptional regulator [Virgibacillus sp. LDC1]|uniref:LysR family transcriptional regulator n=1 Tax=Paenibacillus sp. GM2FR TaxID=2059268 RepID=UPI000CC2FB2F|nr:LysR family transcriptional regulator [Paenibacillus sp. GM2FR]MCV4231648.1 LysR family transcriptional regulator [Virgibacillus sp. LDC1]PJN55553.1 HTH-type transcriptional regulator CysL [Paenibacillus sp. GM2FR]